MALTNFYVIAGGAGSSDTNAGSSIGANIASATNGNWNATTGVYIAPSGTPFATTVAGDYASIFNDGATTTGFVAKVLSKDSDTQITVDVATIKYGATTPTTNATGRSCKVNGSWNSEFPLSTGAGAFGTFTVPQPTKINFKGNLSSSTSRTFSFSGSTTAPLWFSGYNTNPGDLDNDDTNSLAKPVWTMAAGQIVTFQGSHSLIANFDIIGNISGRVCTINSTTLSMQRCRIENTSTNAAAIAIIISNAAVVRYIWCKCPATATTTGTISISGSPVLIGVVGESGSPTFNITTGTVTVINCISRNSVTSGFLVSTGPVKFIGCTVYNSGGDGIQWSGTPASAAIVTSTLFNICGGYGINNASGTNTNLVSRNNNLFYSCTSGRENGFGDSPAFFEQTDSSSVVTSSTDMTPVATSNAKNNGFPGIFENQTYSSFPYIGAVQPQPSSGGGSAVAIFNN